VTALGQSPLHGFRRLQVVLDDQNLHGPPPVPV
jgi:hypothetical protein